mmetsp:Transcript_88309/g.270253  ORF Transcript_88309/g.270253 Transcript_88309/m.270253 type:complete len:229 (+) Transcript_88309:488-1174(+)
MLFFSDWRSTWICSREVWSAFRAMELPSRCTCPTSWSKPSALALCESVSFKYRRSAPIASPSFVSTCWMMLSNIAFTFASSLSSFASSAFFAIVADRDFTCDSSSDAFEASALRWMMLFRACKFVLHCCTSAKFAFSFIASSMASVRVRKASSPLSPSRSALPETTVASSTNFVWSCEMCWPMVVSVGTRRPRPLLTSSSSSGGWRPVIISGMAPSFLSLSPSFFAMA